MSETMFSCTIEEAVATILMTPQEGKPPTLDEEVLGELERCIDELRVVMPRMVLIRSASERYFCLGANINVLQETNQQTIIPWVMRGHRVLNQLEDLPMPVVAVVEGYVMGGGLELAMACDLIFASDSARLAQSEAGLGFIPGWGGTRRLAKRIGTANAKYCYYSGKVMDADRALKIGLVDFAGSKVDLEEEVAEFARMVLSQNTNALSQFKTILNDQERSARDENAAVEAFHSVSCMKDPDTQRRVRDFLSKKRKK